jgi:Permeases
MLEHLFSLISKNTNVYAVAMVGIFCVNPSILSASGVVENVVLLAIVMGLIVNYPTVLGMGVLWQVALGAVFIFGLVLVTHIQRLMVEGILIYLKHAITAGINHKKIRTCCV